MTTCTNSLVSPNPKSASVLHIRAISLSSDVVRTVGAPAPAFLDFPLR